jgi:4-amino-4-deoxy-L-arabinose transferase-like glycosyltransferase
VSAPTRREWIAAALLAAIAVAVRLRNAFTYPADWGFDASFNWRYIYRLTHTWSLPAPTDAWSTSDPPLYFYLAAAVLRIGRALAQSYHPLVTVPLLSVAAGLGSAALAWALVRRMDPGADRRALLAAGLLLYLPAHIHMSAMVNEEIVATLFASAAVFGLALRGRAEAAGAGLRRAAGVGLAGGLALLTKLSGGLVVLCAGATYALDALPGRRWRPALARAALAVGVASLVGGWYFLRNRLEYGYLQPHGLPAHQLMFRMPPGERRLSDYLRIPLATFSDPQLLHPDLLRSVWGSTYATVWFDGHRSFLPVRSEGVRRLGTLTLLLALLPTAAFARGLARGARRALSDPRGPDAPLVILTLLGFAGYAFYTWRNPWFATLKGTSLLSLSLPFAFYASGELERWTRGRAAAWVWSGLAALALAVVLSCSYDLVWEKAEVSGLQWDAGP